MHRPEPLPGRQHERGLKDAEAAAERLRAELREAQEGASRKEQESLARAAEEAEALRLAKEEAAALRGAVEREAAELSAAYEGLMVRLLGLPCSNILGRIVLGSHCTVPPLFVPHPSPSW